MLATLMLVLAMLVEAETVKAPAVLPAVRSPMPPLLLLLVAACVTEEAKTLATPLTYADYPYAVAAPPRYLDNMARKTVMWKVDIPEGTSASHTGDPTCEENVSVILPDTLLAMPSLVKNQTLLCGDDSSGQ